MRKITLVLLFFVLILSACGSNSLSDRDEEACEMYEDTVDAAENEEITDDEMLDELEEAWYKAESEKLQDSLDDLLIDFEEGENIGDSVDAIVAFCSIE